MILTAHTLQIQIYEYFRHLNILIFIVLYIFSFYVININFVNFFVLFIINDFEFLLYQCAPQFK